MDDSVQLLTPVRKTRSTGVNVSRPASSDQILEVENNIPTSGIPNPNEPNPGDVTSATDTTPEAMLRVQLTELRSQMLEMQKQLTTNRRLAESSLQTKSREYWTFPIADTISYPGENASRPAQIAYMQRLHAYLSKSQPIWNLVSGKHPCPISTDNDAITSLKKFFGATWNFQNKDINRALRALKAQDTALFDRVQTAMDDGSDTTTGSWGQRNSALYGTVCETLDLGKNGKDLSILQLVDENNGMALHDLISFRLREIKSTDPLERAMRLNLDLNHIKYQAIPHGVAKYFSEIENHRTELGDLVPPKIINDWQVVAKALRELPALHPKFQEAEQFLALQRKILQTETTLQECQQAFVNADIDNDIHGDLHAKGRANGKKRLRTNMSNLSSPPRSRTRHAHGYRNDGQSGRFKKGDCVHHPFSVTHVSRQCRDPFGLTSAFNRARSYSDKCRAVKKSVEAGWSARATHVKIPQGYGCDDNSPAAAAPVQSAIQPQDQLRTNHASVSNGPTAINDNDLRAYHKVKALISSGNTAKPPTATAVTPSSSQQQHMRHGGYHAPTISPLHAFHAATSYALPRQPPPYVPMVYPYAMSNFPAYPAVPQVPPHQRPVPRPLSTNAAAVQQSVMPPPTDDDLIAAGMRYYATQAGNQHFR